MKKAPLKTADESEYRLAERFPFKTLAEGSIQLDITPQRLSRLLRILQIPVHRKGYTILLDERALGLVAAAVKNREVKPGRKKKSETV